MVPDRVFAMKTVDFSMTVDFTMNDVLPTKLQKEAGLIRIHWSDGKANADSPCAYHIHRGGQLMGKIGCFDHVGACPWKAFSCR